MRASSTRMCITPQEEFYLIGYGDQFESRLHQAQGIHDDIYARSILIETKGKEIFICNADLIEYEIESVNEIKKMMAKTYGLDENLFLLSATHDHHSVMSYHKHWKTGKFSQTYYDFLVDSIKKSYEECHKHLQECEARSGKGFVDGYYGSRIHFGQRADNEVLLVEFKNKENEVIAAICNWATHSTVLSPTNTYLSADFAGNVSTELYKLRGYYPAMIVGAAGDSSNRAQRMGTDFAELERVSKGVAAEINKIQCNQFLNISYQSDHFVSYRVNYLPPDERALYAQKIKEAQIEFDRCEDPNLKTLLDQQISGYSKKLVLQDEIDITLFSSIIKMGDLEIVTIPGELGSKLGIELKALSQSVCCIISGYTNGYLSYILQPELYADSARASAGKYRIQDVLGYMEAIKKVL